MCRQAARVARARFDEPQSRFSEQQAGPTNVRLASTKVALQGSRDEALKRQGAKRLV